MYNKILYLMFFIDLSFFYLLPIEKISKSTIGNYQKFGLVFFILFVSFIFFKSIFTSKRYLFTKNIIFLLLLYILRFVISYFQYNQGIFTLISTSNEYLVILAYFFIAFFVYKYKGLEKIQKVILSFSNVLATLFILQFFIYSIASKVFLYIDRNIFVKNIRYGSVRIYENDYFFIFTTLLAFGLLIKKKINKREKRFFAISFILALFEVIFVSKGRMGLVMVILGCVLLVFLKYRKRRLGMIIITSIVMIVIVRIPIISNSLSSINSNDYSLLTRGDALEYYGEQLKRNPFIGVGFIKPIENTESFYIVRGPNGMFYKSDMGILGSVHTYGIVFLIWYVFICYKILIVLIKTYKNKREMEFLEVYGVTFLIIIGSLVMNPFDPQRIFLFPIMLAMIDYINIKNNEIVNNT